LRLNLHFFHGYLTLDPAIRSEPPRDFFPALPPKSGLLAPQRSARLLACRRRLLQGRVSSAPRSQLCLSPGAFHERTHGRGRLPLGTGRADPDTQRGRGARAPCIHQTAGVQEIGQLSSADFEQKPYKGIFMDETIAGKEREAKTGGNERRAELQSSIYDRALNGCSQSSF